MPDTPAQPQQQTVPVPTPIDPAVMANDQQQIDQAAIGTKQTIHDNPALAQKLGPTPDIQDLVVDVEKDLLAEIVKNLRENTITPEKAKEVAKEFLSLLPMRDKHDLLKKLRGLSDTNGTIILGIYLKYAKVEEEEERKKKLALMSEHIKKGEIEHALAVAKGAITNE